MGKETGGMKMEDPHSLKYNDMAQCSLQSQQPLVCDSFKNCGGLPHRVAISEHATGVHDELGAVSAAWKTMTAQRMAKR